MGSNKREAWSSRWIKTETVHTKNTYDIEPEEYVICDDCGFTLGRYGILVVESNYPKICPCCKRDMENGVK